jgi:hypothetical protein
LIAIIKRGNVLSVILAILFVLILNYLPFTVALDQLANGLHPNLIWDIGNFNVYPIILVLLLFIQGVILSRMMVQTQFFEQITYWPLAVYLMFCLNLPEQFLALNFVLYNFILLYIYNRLFNLHEEQMQDYELYVDIAVVFSIGLFLVPNTLLLLPLVLLMLNLFAVFDINRFLLFLTSAAVLLINVAGLSYLFISREWTLRWWSDLTTLQLDLTALSKPEFIATYIAIGAVLLLSIYKGFGQLRFMQTQNRKIFNMFIFQLIFIGILFAFSGTKALGALVLMSLPLNFIVSFSSFFASRRLLTNIVILLFAFAVIFVQLVYMKNIVGL